MESLSAGLRGLGSMVARAAAGSGGGSADDGPRPFQLGPAGLLAAEWSHAGLQLWLIKADGSVEASHSATGVGVSELGAKSPQDSSAQQRFEDVFEHHARILEQQATETAAASAAAGGLR